MSLQSGRYFIDSKLSQKPVGRNHVEDKSLLPKQVYSLSYERQAPIWTIEQIPGNRYIFKADNAQVSDGRGKLVANLVPEFAEEDAIWELVPTEEDDAFAIVKLDRSAAWFVDSDEDHVPIEIRQFSGRNIDPEVFYIRRAAN